jgi:hypothetical protein
MSSAAAQSMRAVLEYVLFAGCLLIAAVCFIGVAWFWASFGVCAQTFLVAAPIAMLVAAGSVFVPKLGRKTLIFFSAAIVTALALFGVVASGGAGVCAPFSVDTGVWPFAALLLLAVRLGLLIQARQPANGV